MALGSAINVLENSLDLAYMAAMVATHSYQRPARFIKMHGAGNDFVVIDGRGGDLCVDETFVAMVGDRHTGVGFDQLAFLTDTDEADIHVAFFNSDGSPSSTCGNAARCIASIIMDEKDTSTVSLQTPHTRHVAERQDGQIYVNMAPPQLDWAEIPLAQPLDLDALPIDGAPSAVGMGNPHMIFAVDDVAAIDLPARGAALEMHPLYPARTNVEFCEIRSTNNIRVRVWERGTGITLACGSGACASVVALHRRGLVERQVNVEMDGGILSVDWREDGVWLTGPAATVFEGHFAPEFIR